MFARGGTIDALVMLASADWSRSLRSRSTLRASSRPVSRSPMLSGAPGPSPLPTSAARGWSHRCDRLSNGSRSLRRKRSPEAFQEQMRRDRERVIPPLRSDPEHQADRDAIDELSGWYCFSDAYAKEAAAPSSSASTLSHSFSDTFERDAPRRVATIPSVRQRQEAQEMLPAVSDEPIRPDHPM